MSLRDNINKDLTDALKTGRGFELEVLRGVNAALHNKVIEKRGQGEDEELSGEEVLEILKREVKKRKEAIELYKQGNRPELAEKEQREVDVIQKYLPEQLGQEAIEKAVDEVLAEVDKKDFGTVMRAVMAKLKGQVDGKEVAEAVKSRIGLT